LARGVDGQDPALELEHRGALCRVQEVERPCDRLLAELAEVEEERRHAELAAEVGLPLVELGAELPPPRLQPRLDSACVALRDRLGAQVAGVAPAEQRALEVLQVGRRQPDHALHLPPLVGDLDAVARISVEVAQVGLAGHRLRAALLAEQALVERVRKVADLPQLGREVVVHLDLLLPELPAPAARRAAVVHRMGRGCMVPEHYRHRGNGTTPSAVGAGRRCARALPHDIPCME
jgi:hypothetical protein